LKSLIAAAFIAVSLGATAQTVADDPAKKPAAKAAEPKKAEPKKVEPKKAEPKKVEPKKTETKKTEPKKAEPKKTDAKKAAPKKADLPRTAAPEVRVYKNSADAPVLRDKSGNVIPTDPNAYDISSATGKKK